MADCVLPDGLAIDVRLAGGACDLPDGLAIDLVLGPSGIGMRVRARHSSSVAMRRRVAGRQVSEHALRRVVGQRHQCPSALRRVQVAARHVADAALRHRASSRHRADSVLRLFQAAARHASAAALRRPVSARHQGWHRIAASAVAARHLAWCESLGLCAGRHVLPSGVTGLCAARHVLPSGPAGLCAARNVLPSGAIGRVAGRLPVAWSVREAVIGRLASHARMTLGNPVGARCAIAWSAHDASVVRIVGPNHLLHQGRVIALGEGTTLSMDEGSPFWLADLDLLAVEDYARIRLGDALTLVLWGEPFSLVCDGRRFSRGEGAPGLAVSAISPVAMLGDPWTRPVTLGAVGMAHATAQRLLGQAIEWRLVDWPLPESAAALDGSPLDLARQLARAVKGVIEAKPDGTLLARPLYPVSPPEMSFAPAVAVLTDRDLLGHAAAVDVADRDNRFVITSGDPGASADQIQVETEQDPADPHAYTIRAYPYPWRPVELVHTGDAATQIYVRAEITTEHEALIEIAAGTGQAQYPIAVLLGEHYQYADLGRVTVAGREIATARPDYSLLSVRYQARAWQWRATNARTETIQFLAIE